MRTVHVHVELSVADAVVADHVAKFEADMLDFLCSHTDGPYLSADHVEVMTSEQLGR